MSSESIFLREIAHGRSGDKGNHANIGIMAFTQAGYDFLEKALTSKEVGKYFQVLNPAKVERFDLPRLHAFNFLLSNVLDGGASESLRTDSQGKALATALLEMRLQRPDNMEEMVPKDPRKDRKKPGPKNFSAGEDGARK
jgi:hypothetical protein